VIGAQDPIRNALRELVRTKQIWAWNARETPDETEWTVVLIDGHTAARYTTDAVNKLIAMFWAVAR
jgi:hypothetical protein